MDRADYETLPMIQQTAAIVGDSSIELKDNEEGEEKDVTLYQAVRDGDATAVKALLSNRSVMQRVNDLDDYGMSALHYAARDKLFDISKILLDEGRAYAAVKDEDGLTPLHICARKKEKERLKETEELIYLLALLTDVNVRDRYLSTPLHFAAMKGNDIAAKALLQCEGVHVNAKDSLGYTPLHESAVYNDLDVAMLLVEYGADIQARDNNGRTALHLAAMGEDNSKMIKLLLQNVSKDEVENLVNLKDKDHNAALHLAIDARNTTAIKFLLKRGANVNDPCRLSSTGSTPLHLAAITGDTKILDILLSQRAKLTARDKEGCTALHKAVEYQNQEAVKFLLSELQTAPEQRDKDNYTPLLLSACYPNTDIFNNLLQAGSDIHAVDSQERNVVHLVAINNEPDILMEIMRTLEQIHDYRLLNDADKNAETPLHTAARLGRVEIVRILIAGGSDLTIKNDDEETSFLLAAKAGNATMVDMFLQTSSKVLNDHDEYSNSGLHLAAAGGHLAVVEKLVRAGSDKDMRNVRLDTPMDFASTFGHANVVKFLLDEDVSPNDTDDNMDTPLLLASRNGHDDVISVLIERGADVAACDKRGRNCLSLAIDKGHRDAALAIVQSSKWKQSLLHESDYYGRIRDTPMRKLIRNMPDVAHVVLNRCITSSPEDVHQNDKDYWYRLNFYLLDDTYLDYNPTTVKELSSNTDEEPRSLVEEADYYSRFPYIRDQLYLVENHPLMVMVQHKRDDLLSHPLVLSMIRYKWNVARPTYFSYIIFYAIFLIMVTAFMVTATPPYRPGGSCPENQTEWYQYNIQGNFEKGSKYFIMVFAGIGIVSEIVQMVLEKKLYLVQPLNLVDWFTYVSAILMLIDVTLCGAKTPWQWQLGAFCVFATWINFLLLLRRLPGVGIYTVMIQDILKTFSKFALVFFLFLLAFSFTFYILLENQATFVGPGVSIIKTWSMMLGEFSFDDIFFPDDPGDKITYEFVTYVIFMFFLIVMAIVVVNLMTGLAIDDVNELQSHAKLRKLAIQLELAIAMEVSMPDKFRRDMCFSVRGIAMFPNRDSNRVMNFLAKLIDGPHLNKEKIVEGVRALEGERPSEMAQLEMKMDRLMIVCKQERATLENRLEQIEKMLESLISSQQSPGSKKKKKATVPIEDL